MEGQWQYKRVLGLSIFSDCPCAFKLKKKHMNIYIYIYILCVIGYSGRSLKQTFFICLLFLLWAARPKPELLGAVRPDGTQIYSTGSAYRQTVSRLLVMNGRSSAEARATKVGRQYDGIQCVRRQRAPMVPIIT